MGTDSTEVQDETVQGAGHVGSGGDLKEQGSTRAESSNGVDTVLAADHAEGSGGVGKANPESNRAEGSGGDTGETNPKANRTEGSGGNTVQETRNRLELRSSLALLSQWRQGAVLS